MATIEHAAHIGGTVIALSLKQIGSWQLDDLELSAGSPDVHAVLPALQRGAVWRAGQVEALWDSLERRFPIGMLLLTGFRPSLGTQHMLVANSSGPDGATHMLLDGQQRANAIALGFCAPRISATDDAPAALWVDLGEHEVAVTKTSYCMTTRAHPWGYPHRDKQRLEMREIRLAIAAFRAANPDVEWQDRPPVWASWPWEAEVPIPLSVILRARSASRDDILEELTKSVPFWSSIKTSKGALSEQKLVKALQRNAERLRRLVETAASYEVPAQIVELEAPVSRGGETSEIAADPTETLFVRVNSGGTPLQGEDLIYSIIKAIWPDAGKVVDQLEKRFVSAPRAAMLIARLALVSESEGAIPAVPELARFRRLVHGSGGLGYRRRLERYLASGAAVVFAQAYDLLTGDTYGLPPVLAADLARGEEGRDVILLLMRWLELLNQSGVQVCGLSKKQRRRAIGALTCIRWFAHRADRCAALLWKKLEVCAPKELAGFFNRKNMQVCFTSVKNQVPICLVPPPALIRAQLHSRVLPSRGPAGALSDPKSDLWRSWEWYGSFASNPCQALDVWYRRTSPRVLRSEDGLQAEEHSGSSDSRLAEWEWFADKLWGERRLVLYAQRSWLGRWFPRFDPTDPESVEEINRPWDMDHIHPRYFVEKRHRIPQLVKDWHSSIGNLRAWPFDANRSDAEGPPCQKLGDEASLDLDEASALTRYGLLEPEARRDASFIDAKEWSFWESSTPEAAEGSRVPPAYLASAAYAYNRERLIKAIANRLARLYEEWYESTQIASLLPVASHRQ